jgi:hypothetical protein
MRRYPGELSFVFSGFHVFRIGYYTLHSMLLRPQWNERHHQHHISSTSVTSDQFSVIIKIQYVVDRRCMRHHSTLTELIHRKNA